MIEMDVYVTKVQEGNPEGLKPKTWYHVRLLEVHGISDSLLKINVERINGDDNEFKTFQMIYYNDYDTNSTHMSKLKFGGKKYIIHTGKDYVNMRTDFEIWYNNERVNEVLDNI